MNRSERTFVHLLKPGDRQTVSRVDGAWVQYECDVRSQIVNDFEASDDGTSCGPGSWPRHVIALPFVDPRLSDRGTTSAVTGAAASGRTDAARRRPTADNTTTSKASQETSQQRSPKGTDKESKDG